MATVTNRVAAPALNGQGAKITLDSTDSTNLATLTKGGSASVGSNTGKIYSIDVYGNSFIVVPSLPSGRFDSTSTPGQLAVGASITV